MNNAIELITNRGSVWKFEDPALISNEFVSGFLYGGMFLLKQLPKGSYFIVHDTAVKEDNLLPLRIHSVSQLRNFGDISLVELDKVQANMTRYMDVPRKYIFMLYDPEHTGEFNLFYVKSPVFFQGLFTALNAANIPYHQVLLHKPIKNGVAYNIQALNLPHLENIQ